MMEETREIITETLSSLSWLLNAHDGFAELAEIIGNKAAIYCGGQCSSCGSKCIEDAIKEKLPDIEVVIQ